MDRLADQIDNVAAVLSTMDRQMTLLTPAASAFGADEAGRPGRIGRALYAGWTSVLAARAREAAAASASLTEMAHAVRSGAQAYAATDEAARRRFQREL
ncbi:hypothetical protein [Actinoplanes sp. DH11]|uniref:hypothetical protein n=1 Tax=Actinoplanes sp. DH11 TaxID=2857011 RepID=UPI001E3460F4|nr:hypothetical protein [Actinoplanes sp. DH11]